MSKLRSLQGEFMEYLLTGNSRVAGRTQTPAGDSREARLQIYYDAYRIRLLEALGDSYPALHALLGDADFEQLGLDYLRYHPSPHVSIRYFGDNLSGFLARHAPYDKQPFLHEMAQFEWSLREVFDSTDAEALTLTALTSVSPEMWPELTFGLHPAVRLLKLGWNVPQLWNAIDTNAPPHSPVALAAPVDWIIWRYDQRTLFRSQENDEAWLIYQIRNGENFAGLCEGTMRWVDEQYAAPRVAALLHRLVNDGVLIENN